MYGTLELDQDLTFQRKMRNVQRGGWVVMGLLTLAALAGVFGQGGPLAKTKAQNPEKTWTVEYDRYARHGAQSVLRFTFAAGGSSDPVRLKLDKKYLEKFRYEHAVPEPLSMESGPDAVTLVFDVEDPQKESHAVVTLHAQGFGRAESGEIKQFIYP